MKQFKIKVTKCSRDTYWYSEKIGRQYTVVGVSMCKGDSRFIVRVGSDTTFCVLWKDCELV